MIIFIQVFLIDFKKLNTIIVFIYTYNCVTLIKKKIEG